MKSLQQIINEKLKIKKSDNSYNYFPKTKEELKKLLRKLVKERGNEGDFNDIDTSEITDMSELFLPKFNGDISRWNVSNVENMEKMFFECESFNQDISKWNVSNVTNMYKMFYKCKSFNESLNNWDVYHVTSMYAMFYECESFNQPLNDWDVSNVTDMEYMFNRCKSFNQDISNWNVYKVINNVWVFYGCPIQEKYKPKFK